MIAAVALLLGSALASPAPASTPLPHVEISATHTDLGLKGKERHAHLTGNVIARQADLTLKAIDVEVAYAAAEGVERVVATHGVTVTKGTHVANSDRAELDNSARTITLTGNPRVWDGNSLAEGSRIVLHLDDERVECFECAIDVDPDAIKKIRLDAPLPLPTPSPTTKEGG